MKQVKTILAAFILGLFAYGCNSSTNQQAEHEQEQTSLNKETTTSEEHEHDETTEPIELDNGEKWKVNDEMKPFVLKGQELVSAYIQKGGNDYTLLASEVKDQNDALIKSCTMKGKSHEELHKWLHPHLEIVKELSETKDADKAKTLVGELQKSYTEYGNYFQ